MKQRFRLRANASFADGLRRDHVLKSAEAEGFRYHERDKGPEIWVQPRLDGTVELPREP